MKRKDFIKVTALTVVGTGGIRLLSGCSGPDTRWRFFTDAEAKLVDAIAEQIIPSDEWPGGRDSGTTNFIDKQLIGPYRRFQEVYRKGLFAIQESCKTINQKKFEELPWDEQTRFLENMEAGLMKGDAWSDGFDKEFFGLIKDHTLQSYWGSQIHGGNKNKMSYRMIGLDYPLIIGQNRYKS
jgi:gluconate 2-dehydrogenase gamma chain